jgi:hypothetical protein
MLDKGVLGEAMRRLSQDSTGPISSVDKTRSKSTEKLHKPLKTSFKVMNLPEQIRDGRGARLPGKYFICVFRTTIK